MKHSAAMLVLPSTAKSTFRLSKIFLVLDVLHHSLHFKTMTYGDMTSGGVSFHRAEILEFEAFETFNRWL